MLKNSKADTAVASLNRTLEVHTVFRWFILLNIMLLKVLATENRKQRLQGMCFIVREAGPEANVSD